VVLITGALCLGARAAAPDGMVHVPAGDFWMGSDEGSPEERPLHRAQTAGYYIDRHEVTNAEFAAYVADTGAHAPIQWGGPTPPEGTESLPVTNITWFEAMEYAIWAGKRLPTEAEWERAARGDDGRRYPWGQADVEALRNLAGDNPAEPVDSRPDGASPHGCLHMAGNAWEWTADWHLRYPGNGQPSVHYGRKYKVMRGGGCVYYYGIENSGRCAQRARVLPYGKHDFLGFRCAMDEDPADAAYDPVAVLAEARDQVAASATPPETLEWERQYAQWLHRGRFPLYLPADLEEGELIRTGVPLPRGWVTQAADLSVLGPGERPVPLQARITARWDDGSARWALLDFAARADRVEVAAGAEATPPPAQALHIETRDDAYRVETERIVVEGSDAAPLASIATAQGQRLLGDLAVEVVGELGGEAFEYHLGPASRMDVLDEGPLRATVAAEGRLVHASGGDSPLTYDLRLTFLADSARIETSLTLTHMNWRELEPLTIRSARVTLSGAPSGGSFDARVGTDSGHADLTGAGAVELSQFEATKYRMVGDGDGVGEGTRAPGWVAREIPTGQWITLGVRYFWQNHPKTLRVGADGFEVGLWTGEEPFLWEGGLAKTHQIILAVTDAPPEDPALDPPLARLDPAWTAGTKAVGELLPLGPEALAQIPYWEAHQEESMRRWERGMPTGMRHYGDAYMGGPYKGENAYANLEYDVPFNFLWQYLRTGNLWYLESADAQARHQCDIDINHFEKYQWKHSPGHTNSKAEFGHVFVRGLLLHYLLTGEARSLECAELIGDWIATELDQLRGMGNERQIGWSLLALTGLHEVTGDDRFLDPAIKAATHLAEGQTPWGKFDIRWDNRIAFFNGIAMNGMLHVYDLCGDERIATAVERMAERTLGLYPEYACRTLNGFTWTAMRTDDPRYLDVLARTWETCVDYLLARPANAATISPHSHEFLLLGMERSLFPGDPLELDLDPESWWYLRPLATEAEMIIRAHEPGAQLAIVLEGADPGRVDVLDESGRVVQLIDLNAPRQAVHCRGTTLPDAGTYRLRLAASSERAWQVHGDGDSAACLVAPVLEDVESLYPRAYGSVRSGAEEIKLTFEIEGEGFHRAVLFDPQGNPAASVEQFIGFEDFGRYRMELTAPVTDTSGPWSLEVYEARVVAQEGFLPYWAASPEALEACT
jgi:iron(II)-dependent oxidoreductase